MTKVLITGGTGLVGKRLTQIMLNSGYKVNILSRSRQGLIDGVQYFKWDIEKSMIAQEALAVDHIIHLAGAGVADKKWTTKRKKEILSSRIDSSSLIQKGLEDSGHRPRSIISASAVGYYGDRGEESLGESASPGDDFLAEVCMKWEAAVDQVGASLQIPTAKLRIGIVLSNHGGALPKLALPIKFGIGAYLGNGKQYYPWIHIDDLCRMFLYVVENDLEGAFNAVAPHPETNKNISKMVAKVLGRPFIPAPGPAFILRTAMGEMANMLLNGQRASATKILNAGFTFQYPELKEALEDIFEHNK